MHTRTPSFRDSLKTECLSRQMRKNAHCWRWYNCYSYVSAVNICLSVTFVFIVMFLSVWAWSALNSTVVLTSHCALCCDSWSTGVSWLIEEKFQLKSSLFWTSRNRETSNWNLLVITVQQMIPLQSVNASRILQHWNSVNKANWSKMWRVWMFNGLMLAAVWRRLWHIPQLQWHHLRLT